MTFATEGARSVTILDTIGGTRLLPLRHMVPEGSARILLKLEYENPTGSMKDRMARAMIETAKALTLEMIETARRLAQAPGSYWTDQLNNTDVLATYERMADELWEQAGGRTGGRIDAFVQSVGTAGSLRGISARLRGHSGVRVVAVEPAE